jgi:hypothetical protein
MEEKEKRVMPIYVGQVLYYQKTDSRGRIAGEIIEYKVLRLGSKFFYVEDHFRAGRELDYKFDRETLQYVNKIYSQDNKQLYRTKQEILDKQEQNKLTEAIRKHCDWTGNLLKHDLGTLRAVAELLKIEIK